MERSTAEERSERRMRAWRLRLQGRTQREIAATLGISLGQVHADLSACREELREREVEAAEEYRLLQYERAESVVASFFPLAMTGDVRAATVLLKALDFENKLLGLYPAPSLPVMSAGQRPEIDLPGWAAEV